MSKTRENRLWGWLAKVKPILKYLLVLERVENSLMKGMADVNGSYCGKSFWLELKCAARPSNALTKVSIKFQHGQPEWHKRRARAGENTFILIQVGSGAKARRYLVHGSWAERLAIGVKEKELEDIALLAGTCSQVEIIKAMVNSDSF